MFKKTALGMLLLGAAFGVMAFAEVIRGTGQANLMWIVLVGILMSLGEMVFSPLGNSFVSKYAPKKYLGVLMGVWTFATFLAGKGYGYIYAFTLKFDMIKVYTIIPVILFVAAAILFVSDKTLSKLVEEEN